MRFLRPSIVPALLAFLPVPAPAQGHARAAGEVALGNALELVEATLPELQDALRTGLVTSEQLVQAYLARIAAYDDGFPFLNGILALDPTALEQARACDRERAAGRAHGDLFGIPVLVKDNIDVAGLPTTAGALALADSRPPDDAFLVTKLRAAGAIVLGKTTLTEFANFIASNMPSGYSSLGGYGFNPYDPRPLPGGDGRPVLTPGGSSSGSGISVAANLAAVAVGSETSGSILSPASENGVVGIKPTLGLISRDGILPITADQDTPGPLARSVTDAAILLGVLAGFDPADPATAPLAQRGTYPQDYTPFLDKFGLVGKRIAVPHFPYWNFLTQEQRQRMRQAIRVLVREGAEVADPWEIPHQAQLSARGICVTYPTNNLCSSVLLYGFKHDLDLYLGNLGPAAPMHDLGDVLAFNDAHPLETLKYGQAIGRAANRMDVAPGSPDTLKYQQDRARDIELFRGALDELYAGPDGLPATGDEFDAILFPSNVGADAPARAGYPSVCVPAAFLDEAGGVAAHPFGVTFSGPAFSEPALIQMAYDYEQATHNRQPPASAPPLPSDRLVR